MEKRKYRNKQNSNISKSSKKQRKKANFEGSGEGTIWLYGQHAVTAALQNPDRDIKRLLHRQEFTPEKAAIAAQFLGQPELVDNRALQEILPPHAIHQGVAAQVSRLPDPELETILDDAARDTGATDVILVLDQVTDPQNVGAILRSAAAFGARAVVLTERNAAPESGALAKAASGALDLIPLVRVNNLARALAQLADAGYWRYGLDGSAEQAISALDLKGKVALILGAEGAGMRRLTREHCDLLCRLPINAQMESLNVSNAAAIALYEIRREG